MWQRCVKSLSYYYSVSWISSSFTAYFLSWAWACGSWDLLAEGMGYGPEACCALALPVSCLFCCHGCTKAHWFSHRYSLILQTSLRILCDPIWLWLDDMSFCPDFIVFFQNNCDCPLILSLMYTNCLWVTPFLGPHDSLTSESSVTFLLLNSCEGIF